MMDKLSFYLSFVLIFLIVFFIFLSFLAWMSDNSDRSVCSEMGMETVTTHSRSRVFCVDENGYLLSPRKLKRIQEESQ